MSANDLARYMREIRATGRTMDVIVGLIDDANWAHTDLFAIKVALRRAFTREKAKRVAWIRSPMAAAFSGRAHMWLVPHGGAVHDESMLSTVCGLSWRFPARELGIEHCDSGRSAKLWAQCPNCVRGGLKADQRAAQLGEIYTAAGLKLVLHD